MTTAGLPGTGEAGETFHGVADLIAARFHETYERFAPDYGYRTRADSAVPWSEVPEANRLLMRRTVQELLDHRVIGVPFPGAVSTTTEGDEG